MNLYIATDHAGFKLKEALVPFIKSLGYEMEDLGAFTHDADDDYPDFISLASKEVARNPEHKRAIILGGSGQGEAIVANRVAGVRAVVYYGGNIEIVQLGREHNNANVLSLGARFLSIADAKRAVQIFLETEFSREERHIRRINKIDLQ
ncbi:MAG: RpiB/LacA/LacB family sugar-phosphate isomerase [Candidatus Paceibacterota bacterium]